MENKLITVSLLINQEKLMSIHKTDSVEEAVCLHFDLLQDDGIFLKDLQVIDNVEVARSEEMEQELMNLEPRDAESVLQYFKLGLQSGNQAGNLELTDEEKEAVKRYEEEYKKYEEHTTSITRTVTGKNYGNNYQHVSAKLVPLPCVVEATSTCFSCRYYDVMNMRIQEPAKCMDCFAAPLAVEDLKLDTCCSCTNFDEVEGIYKDSSFCEGCMYSDVTMLDTSDKVKEQAEKDAREEEIREAERLGKIITYHPDGTCSMGNSSTRVNSSVILHNKNYLTTPDMFDNIYGFRSKPRYSNSRTTTRITRIKR